MSLPDCDTWPNRPIFLKRASESFPENISPDKKLEMDKPYIIHRNNIIESIIPIDTELFQGKMIVYIKGIEGAPTSIFNNKKREFEFIVQGKFKKNISGDKLYTGQCFANKIDIKAPWLVQTILAFVRTFIRDMEIEADGDKQYIISPVLSTTQRINVSKTGEEPDILGDSSLILEDLSHQGKKFVNMSAAQRKGLFHNKTELSSFKFRKEFTYTFVSYQHVLSLATLEVFLGITNINLAPILGNNPVQFMAVYFDPEIHRAMPPEKWDFFYNIEVWHEKTVDASKQLELKNEEEETATENQKLKPTLSRQASWPDFLMPPSYRSSLKDTEVNTLHGSLS